MWPGSVTVEPVTELMLHFTEVSELNQENLLLQRSCCLCLWCCWKCQVGHKCPQKYHSLCSHLLSSPFGACYLNGFSFKFLLFSCSRHFLIERKWVDLSVSAIDSWHTYLLLSCSEDALLRLLRKSMRNTALINGIVTTYCWDSSSFKNMSDASQT